MPGAWRGWGCTREGQRDREVPSRCNWLLNAHVQAHYCPWMTDQALQTVGPPPTSTPSSDHASPGAPLILQSCFPAGTGRSSGSSLSCILPHLFTHSPVHPLTCVQAFPSSWNCPLLFADSNWEVSPRLALRNRLSSTKLKFPALR